MVAPFVNRWFFAAIVHSAEELLRPAGYDVLLYSLGSTRHERRRAFSGNLLRKRVDAVLVLGLQPGAARRSRRCPRSAARWPSSARTCPAGRACASTTRPPRARAVRHLLDLGHRRIGYIGGEPEGPLHSAALRRPARRATAPSWPRPGCRADPALEVDRRVHRAPAGMAAMDGCWRCPTRRPRCSPPPTRWRWAPCTSPAQAGLRVPQDLSVIGIDDHDMAELFDLTTVAQPVHTQGVMAAEMILRRLAEPHRAAAGGAVPSTCAATGPRRVRWAGRTARHVAGPAGTRQTRQAHWAFPA